MSDSDIQKLKEEFELIRRLLSEAQRRIVDALAILYAPKD